MSEHEPIRHPPERLSRLKVAGFRSLRNVDLAFDDLTILIGANGSGKSNLLSVFTLLSYLASESLQLYVTRRGGASSILYYGPKVTPNVRIELTFTGEAHWSTYVADLVQAPSKAEGEHLIFADERLSFQRDGAAHPFERSLGSGHVESRLPRLIAGEEGPGAQNVARIFQRRLKQVRAYHFHDTSENSPLRLSQDLLRNRELLNSGGNLAAFLYMLQERHPAHYEQIVRTIGSVVPYLHSFILAPNPLSPREIQLRWRDRDPDYEFGAHQLSDGALRTIALITALMQPEELLPAVITIDEPELGLHPSAIGTISQLIRAAARKRQVILATQSTRLLAEFAPEEVVVVRREEDSRGYGEATFERLSRDTLGTWLAEYDLGQLYDMNVTGGGPQ